MARRGALMIVATLGLTALAGCVTAQNAEPDIYLGAPADAVYGGVQTVLLEDDLVNLIVSMRGARDQRDVIAYARCAAAQYALIRDYGFARHVRTNVSNEGGIWRADAVYTVSPALPQGSRTIDAEVLVADCIEQGIPTV